MSDHQSTYDERSDGTARTSDSDEATDGATDPPSETAAGADAGTAASDAPGSADPRAARDGFEDAPSERVQYEVEGRPKLSVENLDVYYGDDHALQDVSIDIPRNSVTALIGPSGCGKSTFLRCLNRMNDRINGARVEGSVELDGQEIYGDGTDLVELRRRVGMVFQAPNPFPKSIRDNVTYGPRKHGDLRSGLIARLLGRDTGEEEDRLVERSLRKAALWEEVEDRLDDNALGLSGGQQQRLCIARCLAVDPDVVLMDEPASALDPIATAKIEDLIEELAEDYTVVVVTHNMQQAARISDQTAVFLTGGHLVEYGDTDQIFENPESERVEDYITGKFG